MFHIHLKLGKSGPVGMAVCKKSLFAVVSLTGIGECLLCACYRVFGETPMNLWHLEEADVSGVNFRPGGLLPQSLWKCFVSFVSTCNNKSLQAPSRAWTWAQMKPKNQVKGERSGSFPTRNHVHATEVEGYISQSPIRRGPKLCLLYKYKPSKPTLESGNFLGD